MSEERWQVTVRVPMRLPDEQREALFNRVADAAKLGAGFTRPQCGVHPENDGAE